MRTISVKASENYNVIVGNNILPQIGEYVVDICGNCKVVVISDSNVFPIYADTVISSLEKAGLAAIHHIINAGEESKNIQTYGEILNYLTKNQITRSDLIIALGGGVVGDISGFVAATYLRGVSYIQVPTSLLAMVDSSVGGKTAIDLPSGKNMVGAFKQPRLVLCDTSVLSTLPHHFFIDGCAEIIKYSVLYDPELFSYLLKAGLTFDPEFVIAKCISFKAAVVEEDEFDVGTRQKLNFGHTLGHGIEVQSNFTLSHGYAIAIGMMIVTKAAAKKGLCSQSTMISLNEILNRFSLPSTTNVNANDLYQSALSDKKRSGGTVNLIVPRTLGNCEIIKTSVSELKSFIEAGL